MKLIIFAGGVGTRLWPLSRANSPKQFDKFFNGKSTLQLAFSRVAPVFGNENIFVQTVEQFKNSVLEQLPDLPRENIIIEPERRNLGPAVCLAMNELKKRGESGAISILWADHLMEHIDEFTNTLQAGEELINKNPNRFVFLAEKPRFANNNLGWIKIGEESERITPTQSQEGSEKVGYSFKGWKYKPTQEECDRMYDSGDYWWNPGYFITSIDFLLEKYKELAPDIYNNVINDNYGEAEKTHFDRAIIEKVDLDDAIVLKANMNWSDPGTLYALKKALEKSANDNVIVGTANILDSIDSFVYNTEKNKLVAGVGLKEMIIINTDDALIVVPKKEVVNITNLINQMKKDGLHKYL